MVPAPHEVATLLRELAAAKANLARLLGLVQALVGSAGDPSVTRLVREGEYWTLTHHGAELRLRDSKGLRYLARLVGQPHVEVHVLDLVGGVACHDRAEAPVYLDRQAKAAYRDRLADLREQLAQAQAFADLARAAHLERETCALTAELARAVGLGGRDRRASTAAERARVNATRTLKEAIARIARGDRDLGRHLTVSIRTGAFCSYAPHRPLAWVLT